MNLDDSYTMIEHNFTK